MTLFFAFYEKLAEITREFENLLIFLRKSVIIKFGNGESRFAGRKTEMDDTMSELSRLLEDVRRKTGLNVRPLEGEENGNSFSVNYCGNAVTLVLDEGDEAAQKLVRYLVENGKERTMPEREEHLKSILLGEGGGWSAFRYMTRYGVPNLECYAIDLLPERLSKESKRHIARCLEGSQDMCVSMDDSRIAVVKFASEADVPPMEFAQFLVQTLYEELGVRAVAGVGGQVRSFSEIARSYLEAATAVRMSVAFKSKGEVHSYREYLLVKLLEEIPRTRLQEYTESFGDAYREDIFGGGEIADTAEAFLENSLNLSETSRTLFMHRNTLAYRLDKIEQATGLDIRKFSDAVTFRVMTILYKLNR